MRSSRAERERPAGLCPPPVARSGASGRMPRTHHLGLATALALSACGGGDGATAEPRPDTAPASGLSGGTVADSILDAWITAAGGLSAWDSVHSLRYTVTTVWFDSIGEVRRMRPRRVELRKTARGEESRVERPEAEGLYVQAFDGETAWAALNGQPLPADHPAAAESEYVARDVVYWIGLPYKLRDPGVYHAARPLPDGGYELAVTFGDSVGAHPGDRYFYYFLDSDPHPEEVHYIEEGRDESDRNRTRWTGFERSGPITYVVKRTWYGTTGAPTKELRVDDVWVNPPLPDSLFRPGVP